MEQNSPNPTPVEVSDDTSVDLMGLVNALGLSEDDKKQFLPNEGGETPESEAGNTPAEDEGVVLEGEPTEEPEVEPTPEPEEKEDDGKLPDSVQRRIDKLTAEKYNASERIAQLEAQLAAQAQQQPQKVAPTPDQPLANVHSHQALAEQREMALKVKEWALYNPEGGSFENVKSDGTKEEVFLDQSQVRDLLVKSNRMLDRDIPARKEYLDTLSVHATEAKKSYPQLFDMKNPDAQLAEQFLRTAPWVKNFPDWPLVIGDYITGYKARTSKSAPVVNKQTTPNVTKPKVIGSPRTQAGLKNAPVKSVRDVIDSTKGDLSIRGAADLLGAFINIK